MARAVSYVFLYHNKNINLVFDKPALKQRDFRCTYVTVIASDYIRKINVFLNCIEQKICCCIPLQNTKICHNLHYMVSNGMLKLNDI